MPPAHSPFVPQDNIIAGNTLLYGATDGQVFINGQVGERFAVRNSARPPWWKAWATTAAST